MTKDTQLFILKQIILLFCIYGIQFLVGTLVVKKNLIINYSRKIVHFVGFLFPIILEVFIRTDQTYSISTFVIGLVIYFLTMAIYIKPIRSRSWIVNRMFIAFDRPEDRPNTLLWFYTQMAAAYVLLAPSVLYFQSQGYASLVIIPILINAIGDGLAEPIGIKYGKHKYQVHAIFSKKKYVRSWEGSACVFITSILVLLLFMGSFTSLQFYILLVALPILMTLAEAKSPHTWDTPFLYAVGMLSIYLVKLI